VSQPAGALAGKSHSNPARGTMQLVVAQGVVLVGGFFTSIILARHLGAELFGVYGVVISALGWLERVLSAGIPGATSMLIARAEHQRAALERSARVLLMGWSALLFLLVWLLAPALGEYFNLAAGTSLLRVASVRIRLLCFLYV
jgi:O-antigen/teichoic acid export membrane protein